MYVIGITGGIASGKSTVARQLRDLGILVIDADEVARTVVEPGKPAWQAIVKQFGAGILNPDHTINRLELGRRVFDSTEQLHRLNALTHPLIMDEIRDRLHKIRIDHPQALVGLEVPLLYETNMDKICDQVWVVWVDYETQITRLMARDGLSRGDAQKRIDAQMPLDEKARRAQVVIDNRLTLEDTQQTVARYFNEIRQVIQ